jgi:CheY-like chemotaxis protein
MRTIAIIEDNPDNQLLFEAVLGDQYRLVQYESGIVALAEMATAAPELVLCDISLPEIDGHEVLRRLKADPALAHLPVVVVTAHTMSGFRARCLAEGFVDYIGKPITDIPELFDVIERWIGTRDVAGPSVATASRVA